MASPASSASLNRPGRKYVMDRSELSTAVIWEALFNRKSWYCLKSAIVSNACPEHYTISADAMYDVEKKVEQLEQMGLVVRPTC